MTDKPKCYLCECCKQTFVKAQSEEAAIAEKEELFPNLSIEDSAEVCEDCFIKIMDHNEPGLKRYEKFIGEEVE